MCSNCLTESDTAHKSRNLWRKNEGEVTNLSLSDPGDIMCHWQWWPARVSVCCSLRHFVRWPLTSVRAWLASMGNEDLSLGTPSLLLPHAPHAWPQHADPSLGCALEDGVYLLHSSPAGRALPIAEKATVQQKGFVWSRPQGKLTHRVGLSPFVSRLKTWPSPPLSPKRPS